MFKDRQVAAGKLSGKLKDSQSRDFDAVIAVTFSGLQTAKKVSEDLELPMHATISSKLHVAGRSELEFGAVTYDGTIWLDDAMVDEFMIDRDFIREMASETREKLRKELETHKVATKRDIKSKNVLIVTDGIASGMQTSASLGTCLKNGAGSITIATPFISEHAYENISELADSILYLKKPRFVASIKDGYASEFRGTVSKLSRQI